MWLWIIPMGQVLAGTNWDGNEFGRGRSRLGTSWVSSAVGDVPSARSKPLGLPCRKSDYRLSSRA